MSMETIIATRPHKVIYREGSQCIKAFDEAFSKADILNEALNQARVEQTGLNIPKLLGVTTVDGKWAIVTQFVEGKTLAQLMAEHPEDRQKHLEFFVDLQLKVHSTTCPMLNDLKAKMHRKINQSGLDATTRYDLHIHLDSMPSHTKTCHGDFNPSNIILTPEGVPYILDWAHVTQGNASADAARTYLLLCLEGDKALAEQYLTLFCQKSDTARQYVQTWMPIVAASQLVKSTGPERDFLLNWVDVVDYQ